MLQIKFLKVILGLLLALNCIGLVTQISASAFDPVPHTKRVLTNVAVNKPAMASYSAIEPMWGPYMAVDGNDNNIGWYGTVGAKWWQVDLLKMYKFKRIEIEDRKSLLEDFNRSYFEVLASKTDTFDEGTYVKLGGIEAVNDALFPRGGKYVLNVDDLTPYRYVRLRKTADNTEYLLSEFRVFAEQTVTEVAQGKQATACSQYSEGSSPDKANDGINDGATHTGWCAGDDIDGGHMHWWRVDLGAAYHISYIEMEDRVDYSNDTSMRTHFDIFGSNIDTHDSTKMANLGSLNNSYLYAGQNDPFPQHGTYQTGCFTTCALRYLMVQKNFSSAFYIAEFKAYEINPEVWDYTTSNDQITLNFSDEMDQTTLIPANIKLYKQSDNSLVNYTAFQKTNNSYTITIPNMELGADYKIIVSTQVKNYNKTAILETFVTTSADSIITWNVVNNTYANANYQVAASSTNNAQLALKLDGNDVPGTSTGGVKAFNINTTIFADGGVHNLELFANGVSVKTASFISDNTAPVITPSFLEGAELKGDFTLDASITDATSGIMQQSTTLDNVPITLPYLVTDAHHLVGGPHALVVSATDNARNIGRKTINFTTDFYTEIDTMHTKRVLMNVAVNKPATASQSAGGVWGPNMAVDGNDNNNGWYATAGAAKWWQVDLLKMYKFKRIEIEDRKSLNQEFNRSYFEVLASKTSSFAEGTYVKLGGIEAINNTLFPEAGKYVIELNDLTPYRYVRLRKTVNDTEYLLVELRVFAEQNVTEIALAKTATGCSQFSTGSSPDKANDGINDSATHTGWCAGDDIAGGHLHWWRVDLGEQYHIGYIEMEDRNNYTNDTSMRTHFDIFGGNTDSNDSSTMTQLTSLYNHYMYAGQSDPFPDDGTYQIGTNATNAYRYLMVKKNYSAPFYIAEFRAYVINPEVLNYTTGSGQITLNFTDTMNQSTLIPANIKLYKQEDNSLVNYTTYQKTGSSYTITIPSIQSTGGYKVVVTTDVKNSYNVPFMEASATTFTAQAREFEITDITYVNSKDGTGTQISTLAAGTPAGAKVTVKNNALDGSRDAILIVALFNADNKLMNIVKNGQTIAHGQQATMATGLDLPSGSLTGYKLKAFLWDGLVMIRPLVNSNIIFN